MKFLNFKTLLDKNIHIHNIHKINKLSSTLYTIIKPNNILNVTYTAVFLYKLYKIFYSLNFRNVYVSFIHFVHSISDKFFTLLLKLTNNNFLNSQYGVKGIIYNDDMLINILILGSWLDKVEHFHGKSVIMPIFYTASLKQKINYMCTTLKFKKISKFIFFFDVDSNESYLKECLSANKFIMGLCNTEFNIKLLDFYIYGNNRNYMAINFILQFIIASQINSSNF